MDEELKEIFARAEDLLLFDIDPDGNMLGKASNTEALLCQDIAKLRKYVEAHERVVKHRDDVGLQLTSARKELAEMQGNNGTEDAANKQRGRIATLEVAHEDLRLLTQI